VEQKRTIRNKLKRMEQRKIEIERIKRERNIYQKKRKDTLTGHTLLA
jgi:hypothetical protein